MSRGMIAKVEELRLDEGFGFGELVGGLGGEGDGFGDGIGGLEISVFVFEIREALEDLEVGFLEGFPGGDEESFV